MLTAIKKLTVIALVLAFAMPAMAKVTPAHKYQQEYQEGNFEKCEDPITHVIYNCKEKNPSKPVTGIPCSSYGWYTEAEALKIFANSFTITALTNNGSCSKQTLSDRTCYSCSCPASYQYVCSPSGRPGYKRGVKPANGANSCTLFSAGKSGDYNKTQPYYTGCDCNASEGYIPNGQFNPSVLGLFSGGSMTTAEGSKGGAAITCYDVNSFSTCITNSGGLNGQTVLAENVTSVTGSVSSATLTFNTEKGVTYTAKPLLNTADKTMAWGGVTFNNKYCTTNATISSPLMTSAPSEECVTFSSRKANHYDKTYYYYTGCVNDGFCQTSSNDCVLASTTNITIYTPGNTSTSSLTCAKTTGCKNGLVETTGGAQIFCKEVPSTNYTAAGFNFLTTQANTTAGTKFCARVSCNTANKWEQYPKNIAQYSGSVDYTTHNESSATHYRYDAQKQTAGSNTLVCRQPNGCLTESDWYNFACAKSTGSDVTTPANKPELCWEGYLSYWLPRSSTPVSCTVANCAQCNSSGTCIKCNEGYTMNAGVCNKEKELSCAEAVAEAGGTLVADGATTLPNTDKPLYLMGNVNISTMVSLQSEIYDAGEYFDACAKEMNGKKASLTIGTMTSDAIEYGEFWVPVIIKKLDHAGNDSKSLAFFAPAKVGVTAHYTEESTNVLYLDFAGGGSGLSEYDYDFRLTCEGPTGTFYDKKYCPVNITFDSSADDITVSGKFKGTTAFCIDASSNRCMIPPVISDCVESSTSNKYDCGHNNISEDYQWTNEEIDNWAW